MLARRKDGYYDLSFENGDLQCGKSLENAVLISIGSDARVAGRNFADHLQDDGWWAESTFGDDRWGSLLFTCFRKKNDSNLLLLARQYVEESLRWMIDDGVVSSTQVDVSSDQNSLMVHIKITRDSEVSDDYRFNFLWNELFSGAA